MANVTKNIGTPNMNTQLFLKLGSYDTTAMPTDLSDFPYNIAESKQTTNKIELTKDVTKSEFPIYGQSSPVTKATGQTKKFAVTQYLLPTVDEEAGIPSMYTIVSDDFNKEDINDSTVMSGIHRTIDSETGEVIQDVLYTELLMDNPKHPSGGTAGTIVQVDYELLSNGTVVVLDTPLPLAPVTPAE